MKLKDFLKLFKNFNPETEVFIASDAEGNSINKLMPYCVAESLYDIDTKYGIV